MSSDDQFLGFFMPNTTEVPNELFDELLPDLSESELKVLLYIIRHVRGFKRELDAISLRQMVAGVKTKDGRPLDRGLGLAPRDIADAVRDLVAKGVLIAVPSPPVGMDDEPFAYAPHLDSPRRREAAFVPLRGDAPGVANGRTKREIANGLRWTVWERDNFTCRACGSRRHLSIDHIIAESRGGPTTLENLQTLCRRCNARKGRS